MAALADSGVRNEEVAGTAAVSSRVAMERAEDVREAAEAAAAAEGMMAEGENAEADVARRTHAAAAAIESFIFNIISILEHKMCCFQDTWQIKMGKSTLCSSMLMQMRSAEEGKYDGGS